jgi:H+-transporting ATPase
MADATADMDDSARAPADRQGHTAAGLTTEEARRRLEQYGPNAVAEEKPRILLALAGKFWAPVPWMLEATIVLELILRKDLEAGIIGLLVVFNAVLSFFQESRAQGALALLRSRLAVRSRVMRDGSWGLIPAQELVPGDLIYLRMGDLVPADARLLDGALLLDQSVMTGEAMPVEAGPGASAFAGSMVKRGEANGEVTATGPRTCFGRTAELVRAARTASHLQTIILTIVKYMVALDSALVAVLLIYSQAVGMPLKEMLPFALILLVASVPVALPATFTLATALGAVELARRGVLVTRLSAIEEAAAMDVLCSDKTGTITQNRLTLAAIQPYQTFTEQQLLRFACYASDEATQDPIDLAILAAAKSRNVNGASAERLRLIPFDPATKLAEAVVKGDAAPWRVLKGAPAAVAARIAEAIDLSGDVERLAAQGFRVLAVAAGPDNRLALAGLLAFEDPPREDSRALVSNLSDLGVRIMMVTGDGLATAKAIAAQVGITGQACSATQLRHDLRSALDCDLFAGVFPEDKFDLVRALQHQGHIVGMTGDGVNDAPALKQAEVGIAVANATDVAKAAASLVLTDQGLTDIVAAVETSRRIYQRMLTYTLNKIVKTVEIGLFLSIGVMVTRSLVITPALIVLLLFTNDFVTMSISTDRVSFSTSPDRWRIATLMVAGGVLGGFILILSFGLFIFGRQVLGLPLAQLQTLVFITLVFSGQGTVYLVRERSHFWHSAPSGWMLLASIGDIVVVSALAIGGILMAPLKPDVVGLVLGSCIVYLCALDFVKVAILRSFASTARRGG